MVHPGTSGVQDQRCKTSKPGEGQGKKSGLPTNWPVSTPWPVTMPVTFIFFSLLIVVSVLQRYCTVVFVHVTVQVSTVKR